MDLVDKEYVQRCRDGHCDDFRMLVSRYQGLLLSFLGGRLSDHAQVEEAAQESFVRAFVALKKLRKPESFCAWLLGIAGRVAKEQYRDVKRRQQGLEIAEAVATDLTAGLADDALDEAIAALPETYRQVILLRYFEGLSCQQIAERLEKPLGTVTKTLSRAYALLRQDLAAREPATSTVQQTEQP